MDLTDTVKLMLTNHVPLMKARPGNASLNPLIMPPKRPEGAFGTSALTGISPSPIGSQVSFNFLSLLYL